MRSNLENIEQVDLYLQGKLTGDNLAQFEAELASNASLKQLVNDQQLFIQSVNRKALLAEISAVAGIGLTPWYLKPLFGLSVVAVGIIATGIYFMVSANNSAEEKPTVKEEIIAENTNAEEPFYEEHIEVIGIADTAMYEDVIVEHKISGGRNNNSKSNHTNQVLNSNESFKTNFNSSNESRESDKTLKDEIAIDSVVTTLKTDKKTTKNRTAEFKNGDDAMQQFIAHNIKYPATAKEKKLSGNVKVTFIVNSDGKISEISADCYVLRDKEDKPLNNTQFVFNQKVAGLFERECERIMRIMPAWSPATDSNGNNILTYNELQFNFNQNEGIFIYRAVSTPINDDRKYMH